jgi:hypothetical protein
MMVENVPDRGVSACASAAPSEWLDAVAIRDSGSWPLGPLIGVKAV